jgi:hypothetical protein
MAESQLTSPDIELSEKQDSSGSRWTLQRLVLIAVAAFIGIYVIVFAIGFIAALLGNGGAASFFQYFRDLMTIALSITSIVVIVGLGIRLIQIARFVKLLRSEVTPIAGRTKQAV